MVKNFYVKIVLVFILLIISYFLPSETPTGFVVDEDSNIAPEVQIRVHEEGEVDVIVKLKDIEGNVFIYDNKEADIEEVKEEIKLDFEEKHDFEELDAFSGKITQKGLEELELRQDVAYVQIDHPFKVQLQDSLNIINVSKLHAVNFTGKNIGVCVLDTGLNYSHSELIDNFVAGYDYINSDSDPYDDHGHGTHVSGIVEGVVPDAKLLHVKVLNSAGSGSESDIVAGINWCINNRTLYNITVITMSLGAGLYTNYCDSNFPTLTQAINNAITNNIIVIASTGNDFSTTSISAPGCIENVTAVSATDKSDNLANYANRNNLVDLVATGSDIQATSINGGYTTLSGTSMAAPHVAGSAALIQQYKYEDSGSYLGPYNVEELLENTGVNISGYKRINVYRAVTSLDDDYPSLVVYSPISTTYTEKNITLNYSASDLFLETVYYNLNGSNITVNRTTNLNVEGGNHTLKVYAVDGNNNINFTSVNFIVGLPSVTLYNPLDSYNDIDGYVEFNCSISSDSGVLNLSLYHNISGNFSLNQSVSLNGTVGYGVFNLNISGNLTLKWSCLGYDINGNYDWGENRTLRININNAPVIETYYPNVAFINISEPNAQLFNVTYNDFDGDSVNVSWYLNNNYVASDKNYSYGGNYLSAGDHTIIVDVSDIYGMNDTFAWNLNIQNVEVCGDNVKNSSEQCDGSNFGGLTCSNYGYNSGNLACSNCVISTSGCSNTTSGGNTGGDGGDEGGQQKTKTNEKLTAFSDLKKQEVEEVTEKLVEEEIEENIEVEAPEEEGQAEEIISEVTKKERNYAWIGGAIAALIGGIFILLLFKREWRVIRGKS